MSKTSDTETKRARNLGHHLKVTHGINLKHTQLLEALAATDGHRNRHVAAAAAPVLRQEIVQTDIVTAIRCWLSDNAHSGGSASLRKILASAVKQAETIKPLALRQDGDAYVISFDFGLIKIRRAPWGAAVSLADEASRLVHTTIARRGNPACAEDVCGEEAAATSVPEPITLEDGAHTIAIHDDLRVGISVETNKVVVWAETDNAGFTQLYSIPRFRPLCSDPVNLPMGELTHVRRTPRKQPYLSAGIFVVDTEYERGVLIELDGGSWRYLDPAALPDGLDSLWCDLEAPFHGKVDCRISDGTGQIQAANAAFWFETAAPETLRRLAGQNWTAAAMTETDQEALDVPDGRSFAINDEHAMQWLARHRPDIYLSLAERPRYHEGQHHDHR